MLFSHVANPAYRLLRVDGQPVDDITTFTLP